MSKSETYKRNVLYTQRRMHRSSSTNHAIFYTSLFRHRDSNGIEYFNNVGASKAKQFIDQRDS